MLILKTFVHFHFHVFKRFSFLEFLSESWCLHWTFLSLKLDAWVHCTLYNLAKCPCGGCATPRPGLCCHGFLRVFPVFPYALIFFPTSVSFSAWPLFRDQEDCCAEFMLSQKLHSGIFTAWAGVKSKSVGKTLTVLSFEEYRRFVTGGWACAENKHFVACCVQLHE